MFDMFDLVFTFLNLFIFDILFDWLHWKRKNMLIFTQPLLTNMKIKFMMHDYKFSLFVPIYVFFDL